MGIFIFIFGLIVGSFLNVCIYRMPLEQSVAKPARSFCPHCKKKIAWYDNIPLISYILLGGKCRHCHAPVSFRYFFVELLTGLSFLGLYLYYGNSVLLVPYCFMVACFIVATFVDFQHRIIPDEISIGGMYAGLVFSLFLPALHTDTMEQLVIGRYAMWFLTGVCFLGGYLAEILGPKPSSETDRKEEGSEWGILIFVLACLLVDLGIKFALPDLLRGSLHQLAPYLISLDFSIIGLLIGGGAIYFMGVIGDIVFRKESMGGGDVKLLAMIGAFLGWQAAILTFFIAPFFGAFFGIIEKIRTKDTAIAYGPFLVAGALICLFYRTEIIHWLLYRYSSY